MTSVVGDIRAVANQSDVPAWTTGLPFLTSGTSLAHLAVSTRTGDVTGESEAPQLENEARGVVVTTRLPPALG
jgi:hypothetical protein